VYYDIPDDMTYLPSFPLRCIVQTGVQKMHFTRSGTIVPRSRAIVERIVLTFFEWSQS
jgi:hypothetical protein